MGCLCWDCVSCGACCYVGGVRQKETKRVGLGGNSEAGRDGGIDNEREKWEGAVRVKEYP